MSTLSEETAIVRKLQVAMREKLRENRSKPHWRSSSDTYFWSRVREEIAEMREAMTLGLPPDKVWAEAADIANFVAMVAANYEEMYHYERD